MQDPAFPKPLVMEYLYRHVEHLSVKIGERHQWREDSLRRTVEYIELTLASCGYEVSRQTYPCYNTKVSNLIVQKKGTSNGVIVIGAHYDTVPGTPGADDNASGVAVLLELARLLHETSIPKTLLLSALANEEPPFFGTSDMGSMVFAKSLKEQGTPVEVMISLEMVGYYRREPIQKFPLPGMGLIYPRTGDFIGIAGNFRSSKYLSLFKKGLKKNCAIDVASLMAPECFAGINLSDNRSFWRHGFRALMITDTAFYRNPHYHGETDTIDTLDFDLMAEVVRGLYYTLGSL